MNRARLITLVGVTLAVAPVVAMAQTPLVGTSQIITTPPADDYDPHVSCNLVSYTIDLGGVPAVRLFDFATNIDVQISGPLGAYLLSDVSGSRVAYTRVTAATGARIEVVDVVNNTHGEVSVSGQSFRSSIGGDLVAYEERSFRTNTNESEIVVHDLATGISTRITDDALMDINPVVSPSGDAVVFQKCQTTGFDCDVYVAIKTAPGVFTTSALTGAGSDDRNPATDGVNVVYEISSADGYHIAYVPLTGGVATVLPIAGVQRGPKIVDNLISFESRASDSDQFDVFLYDMFGSAIYQVTNSPADETRSDMTLCGGVGRIVGSSAESVGRLRLR
jgi:hypothetical protein